MCSQEGERSFSLVGNMPHPFACYRIIKGNEGSPLDYEFFNVNTAFENMSGLLGAEIIGKRVSEVFLLILGSSVDWADLFGRVAQTGRSEIYQDYLNKRETWYEVTVYRDKPGFLASLFRDITEIKEDEGKAPKQKSKYVSVDITLQKGAEEMLREKEERFQKMLALIPDMISIQDTEMNIIYSNWGGFTHITEENRVLHSKCYKTYRDYDEICPGCKAKDVLSSREAFRGEVEIADGRWIDLRVIPVLDDNNNLEFLIKWVREITDRKEVEETLRRQNNLLEGIINGIPDVLAIQCPDHTIERYNQAGYDMLGMTPEQVKNKKCYELIGRKRECEECATSRALQSKKLEELEKYIPELDIYLNCRSNPILDEEGNVVILIEQLRDITREKKAEKKLRQREEQLRGILESQHDMIVRVDLENRFTYVNEAYCKTFGKSREELIGQSFTPMVHEEDLEDTLKALEKVFEPPYRAYMEQRALTVKGWRWITWEDSGILNEEGQVVEIQGVGRDITSRKKMEEELLKASKLESIGLLAGGIAHDFNNLLAVVLGNISISLKELAPGDKLFDRLKKAEKAIHQAADLTRQLQTFAKGGAPVKKTASIKGLMEEVASFALSGSNVDCIFSFPQDLYYVNIDIGQISQVAHNIIINALQAMPEGGIIRIGGENIDSIEELEKRTCQVEEKGPYVKLTIQDNGEGIPRQNLEKIFDPFYSSKVEGTGMGLATTYSIVKRHGGCISVESEPGKGTTFYIYLPASSKEMPSRDIRDEALVKGSGRLLVMDDEESVRNTIGEMAGLLGYKVSYARNGNEAVRMYEDAFNNKHKEVFDAVILDLTVPGGMGGKQAAREILALDGEAKLIVSSGYSRDPLLADYKGHGFKGFLAKPYEIEQLSRVLGETID